jgi:hypothetical protein
MDEIMSRLLFFLFSLLIFSKSIFSTECVVDTELCRTRGGFIYQLNKLYQEVQKDCGKKISYQMDWTSFSKLYKTTQDYSSDPCLIVLETIDQFCKTDLSESKKLLDKVDVIQCKFAEKDKRVLKVENKKIVFESDLTNDFRSDRPGPSNTAFVSEELKKMFSLNPVSKEDKKRKEDDAKKEKEKNDRLDKQKAEQEKNRKASEDNKNKILAKADAYKAEVAKLTVWFQSEMSTIQKGTDAPEVKGKKLQELGAKYQSELQKAQDAYNKVD